MGFQGGRLAGGVRSFRVQTLPRSPNSETAAKTPWILPPKSSIRIPRSSSGQNLAESCSHPQGDTAKLKELSKSAPAIITSFPDNHRPLPYNVASLTSNGEESERYQKRKLFAGEKNMHTPGSRAVAVPFEPIDGSIGLNICFDSCYPSVIRETAALPDVKVIALPTIDPESKNHFVAAMHAAYTPFRAAENGVSIIRADGRFGSMFVDTHGQITTELKDVQSTEYGWLATIRGLDTLPNPRRLVALPLLARRYRLPHQPSPG